MPKSSGYIEAKAKRAAELTAMAGDLSAEVSTAFTRLLNAPDDRDPEIGLHLVAYFIERMTEETGSEELAIAYWFPILQDAGSMTFDEFNSIPQPKRGDVWTTARKLLVAWCSLQAMIDAGVYADTAKGAVFVADKSKEITASERLEIRQEGIPRG